MVVKIIVENGDFPKMRSYKTTISGVVSAAASFVMFAQIQHMYEFPKLVQALAMFAQVGGMMALGVTAKDYNVSGPAEPPNKDSGM